MRVIFFFFATGLKLASGANNATEIWSLNMTYTLTAKRQLDPGRTSRNTFTAPLQCRHMCDMGCKVYLWELVLILSRHCWHPWKQIHYQKGMIIKYDKYTYPANDKGSWILDGPVETPSLHLFFNVDVCETSCKVYMSNIYIYIYIYGVSRL